MNFQYGHPRTFVIAPGFLAMYPLLYGTADCNSRT
jgi:hypothetical protein